MVGCSSLSPANMKRQNLENANVIEFPGRITRARAASLHTSRQFPPLKACTQPTQQSQKPALRANPKRAAVDENNENAAGNACIQHKRRAVLQDVTNVLCKPSYGDCFNTNKVQVNMLLIRFVHNTSSGILISVA